MTVYRIPPTTKQTGYVADLQRKLRLSDVVLDVHCRKTWGRPYQELDKSEVSALIDTLKAWDAVPAELKREMGQLDLIPEGLL